MNERGLIWIATFLASIGFWVLVIKYILGAIL